MVFWLQDVASIQPRTGPTSALYGWGSRARIWDRFQSPPQSKLYFSRAHRESVAFLLHLLMPSQCRKALLTLQAVSKGSSAIFEVSLNKRGIEIR